MLSKSLFDAVRRKDTKFIEHLFKQGANPNIKNYDWNTPLYFAAYNKDPEIVEILLQHGADANVKNKLGNTPLLIATYQSENAEVIEALLRYGADPNIKDARGYTLLFSAAYNKDLKFVETLLRYGADPNIDVQGFTPLFTAVKGGEVKIVEVLLQYQADVNAIGNQGDTPLYHADCLKPNPLCDLLISHGAMTNKKSNFLYLVGASPNYHDKDTLVTDLEELLDQEYLNLNPPDPELQELITAMLTPRLYTISDSSDLSMTVSSLILRTLSVFSPFLIG